MRRGGVFVVVGGLLIVGATVSFPYWSQIGREFLNRPPSPVTPKSPVENRALLEKRITEYWQARVKGDHDLTLPYEHPVQRKQLGNAYRKVGATVNIENFSLLKVEIEPDGEKAKAHIGAQYTHDFKIPGAGKIKVDTSFNDYWQKDEGIWYHVLDLKVIPDGRPFIAKQTTPAG
jgi:hypothetical protein